MIAPQQKRLFSVYALTALAVAITVKQVVAWFEKDGKIRREQGTDAAFLDL